MIIAKKSYIACVLLALSHNVYAASPPVLSENGERYFQSIVDAMGYQDKIDSASMVGNSHANVSSENFGGDEPSAHLHVDANIDSSLVQPSDVASVHSNGQFMRLLNATESFSLYASVSGHFASKKLDVSQDKELDDMYAAKDSSEHSYVLNLESRMPLLSLAEIVPGVVQLMGFIDIGTMTVSNVTWVDGLTSRTLSGAGGGFNWAGSKQFEMKVYFASKQGYEVVTTSPDSSGHLWIQVVELY